MIVCRSGTELDRMRTAGRLVGDVLTELASKVVPGVTTSDLDEIAERLRAAEFSQRLRACGLLVQELIHALQQAIPQRQAFSREVDCRRS